MLFHVKSDKLDKALSWVRHTHHGNLNIRYHILSKEFGAKPGGTNMKFLITGANGFAGKPLGTELLRQNYEVRAGYASLYRASLKIQIPSFRRRPESSGFTKNAFVSVRCTVCFIDWTPAFAGVTNF